MFLVPEETQMTQPLLLLLAAAAFAAILIGVFIITDEPYDGEFGDYDDEDDFDYEDPTPPQKPRDIDLDDRR